MKIFNYQHSDSFDRYAEKIIKTSGLSGSAIKELVDVAQQKGIKSVDDIAELVSKTFGREVSEEAIQQATKKISKSLSERVGMEDISKRVDSSVRVQVETYVSLGKNTDEVLKAKGLGLSTEEVASKIKEIDALKNKISKNEIHKKKILSELRGMRAKGIDGAGKLAEMEKKLADSEADMALKNSEIASKMNQIDSLKSEIIDVTKKYTDSLEARLEDAVKQNKMSSEMYERIIKSERDLGGTRGWNKALKEGKVEGPEQELKELSARMEAIEKKLVSESTVLAKEVEEIVGKEAAGVIGKSTSKSAKEGLDKVYKEVEKGLPAAKKTLDDFLSKRKDRIIATTVKWTHRIVKAAALYYVYKHFSEGSSESNEFRQALIDARTALSTLNFNPGTEGLRRNSELVAKISSVLSSIDFSKLGPAGSEEDFGATGKDKSVRAALSNIDEMLSMVELYLRDADSIKGDLISETGWPEAQRALENLVGKSNSFVSMIAPKGEDGKEGFSKPEGSTGPEGDELAKEGPKRKPIIKEIYGAKVDISSGGPGFRSSVPRIISRVLNTPTGQAFVDPEDKWGGFFQDKSPDPQIYYTEVLRFLFKKQIDSERKLREYMRKSLSKVGRKRLTGWKEAIKYYKENPYHIKDDKNPGTKSKIASNIQKNNDLYNPNDFSINKENISLSKMADQFSKSYYEDQVMNLSDSMAKSYYAGLKSMYDQDIGRRDADAKALYQTHDETGAELVIESHPKAVVVSDSMGKGGLVENGLEQKQHMEDVALSMPTGNYRSKHAWVVTQLVKIAEQADQEGCIEASDLIDSVTNGIASLIGV